MKKSTQAIVISALLTLIITQLASCGNDNCPEIKQPPIQDLTEFEKQRFPYDTIDQLTFLVIKDTILDTMVYEVVKREKLVRNIGNGINIDNGCEQKFESRYRGYQVTYQCKINGYFLIFKNRESPTELSVTWSATSKWDMDSTYAVHGALDRHFGVKNDKVNSDTVMVLDSIVFENAFRGSVDRYPAGKTYYAYSYPIGFVYLYDENNDIKWILLD
ncbi:MAG: hypothetical protein KDC92_12990 [Bacteroidetes bacterium]|nr:hypothetical protein [Bacteroidota bacterium]